MIKKAIAILLFVGGIGGIITVSETKDSSDLLLALILIVVAILLFRSKTKEKPAEQIEEPSITAIYKPENSVKETIEKPSIQPSYYKSPVDFYDNYVVFDTETTGLSHVTDQIIELAAIKVIDGEMVDSFNTLINPEMHIPSRATKVNNITDDMVKDSPKIEEALHAFIDFIEDYPLIAHNAPFDMKFLCWNASKLGIPIPNLSVNTLPLCRRAFPDSSNHKLKTMAEYIGYSGENYHRALSDVEALVEIYKKCREVLDPKVRAEKAEQDAHQRIIKILEKANIDTANVIANKTSSYLSLKLHNKYFINVKFSGQKKYIAVRVARNELDSIQNKYDIEETSRETRIYVDNPEELENMEDFIITCYNSVNNNLSVS